MKTSQLAAVAAAHSVDPDRWQSEFSAVLDRIESRFARYEPLRHAGELMAKMVSGLDRKNCWTIAENRGDDSRWVAALAGAGRAGTPRRSASLREYVIDAFGDPGAILVVDETGDVEERRVRTPILRHRRPDRELPGGGLPDPMPHPAGTLSSTGPSTFPAAGPKIPIAVTVLEYPLTEKVSPPNPHWQLN